jgi:hypothetical protein
MTRSCMLSRDSPVNETETFARVLDSSARDHFSFYLSDVRYSCSYDTFYK